MLISFHVVSTDAAMSLYGIIDMHVYLHIIGVDFRLCFWINLRVHAFLVHSNEIANSLDDC